MYIANDIVYPLPQRPFDNDHRKWSKRRCQGILNKITWKTDKSMNSSAIYPTVAEKTLENLRISF